MVLQYALSEAFTQKFSFGGWRGRNRRGRSAPMQAADMMTAETSADSATATREKSTWYSSQRAKQKLGQVLTSIVATHTSLAQQSVQFVQQRLGWSNQTDVANSRMSTEEELVANIASFLQPAPVPEVTQARLQADLSNLAYDVSQITPDLLKDKYGLSLVATSTCYPHQHGSTWATANAAPPSEEEAAAAADPLAAAEAAGPAHDAALDAASNIIPIPESIRLRRRSSSRSPPGSPRNSPRTPGSPGLMTLPLDNLTDSKAVSTADTIDRLTSSDSPITVTDGNVLGFVESVASMALLHPERLPSSPKGLRCAPYSFGSSTPPGFDNYPSTFIATSGSASYAGSEGLPTLCSSDELGPTALELEPAAAAAAVESLAAGEAAAEVGVTRPKEQEQQQQQQQQASEEVAAGTCSLDPSEDALPEETLQWFIADDPSTHVRHFVIQVWRSAG